MALKEADSLDVAVPLADDVNELVAESDKLNDVVTEGEADREDDRLVELVKDIVMDTEPDTLSLTD